MSSSQTVPNVLVPVQHRNKNAVFQLLNARSTHLTGPISLYHMQVPCFERPRHDGSSTGLKRYQILKIIGYFSCHMRSSFI